MGQLVYILGRSGTGKSFSLRNFQADEVAVINVQGKILPFKGSGKIRTVSVDKSDEIVRAIEDFSGSGYKRIVIDDFQYVMANEYMRRSAERGYDKFTEIARHAWDICDCVTQLPPDVIVYVLCHTDTDQDGVEKLKTIGKLLDEKIVLEGMSTIVLKTVVSDGQYMFVTQNNGRDTVKSPDGMFQTYAIDNDLKYVDDKIRNYYELGEYKTDEEIKAADVEAEKPEVQKEEGKKRRGRKKKEEEPTEAPTEEAEAEADDSHTRETFERSRRRRTTVEEDPEEVPKRKERTEDTGEDGFMNPPKEEAEEKPVRRRRRKVSE